jgi:endo-1,4-beta-D-glucanase Y
MYDTVWTWVWTFAGRPSVTNRNPGTPGSVAEAAAVVVCDRHWIGTRDGPVRAALLRLSPTDPPGGKHVRQR